MPYNQADWTTQPNALQRESASKYKIKGYGLTLKNIDNLKKCITAKLPVVISMKVDKSHFGHPSEKLPSGEWVYKSFSQSEYDQLAPLNLHALTIVGFDDSKNAFKLYNSWGATWGNGGYIWLDYSLLETVVTNTFLGFTSPDKVKDITGSFTPDVMDSGAWSQKADFPIPGSISTFQFTALNKIYIGGSSYDRATGTFYFITSYDPSSNKWESTNVVPKNFGDLRGSTAPFVIGTKAYFYSINTTTASDLPYPLREYDIVKNTITDKGIFDENYSWRTALSCSIGNKGYFGLGQVSTSSKNPNPAAETTSRRRQLWEYDPSNDTWVQKASIPHTSLFSFSACGVINNKLYVIIWDYVSGLFTYMYDPSNDTWTKKANLASAVYTSNVCFVANNKLYYGIGSVSYITTKWAILYSYDPTSDKWTQVKSFPGSGVRTYLSGASVANKAYVGLGASYPNNDTFYKDWWEYSP